MLTMLTKCVATNTNLFRCQAHIEKTSCIVPNGLCVSAMVGHIISDEYALGSVLWASTSAEPIHLVLDTCGRWQKKKTDVKRVAITAWAL